MLPLRIYRCLTTSFKCNQVLFTEQSRYFFVSSFLAHKDFYRVLGINKQATGKEIKRAYFDLAKKYHPDTNPGNKEASGKFQEISRAYEVLGNLEKRRQYDTFRSQGNTGPFNSSSSHQTGAGYNPYSGGSQQWTYRQMNDKDAEELFKDVFKEFSFNNSGKNTMFSSMMSKMFHGVNSKVLKEMMKGQTFSNSEVYEIKLGPNGIEFVKKNEKKK